MAYQMFSVGSNGEIDSYVVSTEAWRSQEAPAEPFQVLLDIREQVQLGRLGIEHIVASAIWNSKSIGPGLIALGITTSTGETFDAQQEDSHTCAHIVPVLTALCCAALTGCDLGWRNIWCRGQEINTLWAIDTESRPWRIRSIASNTQSSLYRLLSMKHFRHKPT